MQTEDVSFFQDDGFRIDATLYSNSEQPHIPIIFCNGFCASRRMLAPEFCEGLALRADCAVLALDYSGWGTSDGPRERLDPEREVRDVRAATSWMIRRMPGSHERISLLGISFGAAIATVAASRDERVNALIALSGFEDGKRIAQENRPAWEYRAFLDRIEEDRSRRVVTGRSEPVHPIWVLPRDPEAIAFNRRLLDEFPERRFSLDILSAENFWAFDPGHDASRLRRCRSLFIAGDRDLLIPWQHSADLSEEAGGEFLLVPGVGHYDFYVGDRFAALLDSIAAFLDSVFPL